MSDSSSRNSEQVVASAMTALSSLTAEQKQDYYDFLVASDAELKATIDYFRTQVRPVLPLGGSVEFGIIPYWLKNPNTIPDYDKLPDWVVKILTNLEKYGLVPPPTVTDGDYAELLAAIKAGTAIADDGTMFGEGPYQQLNTDWLQAPVNDVLTHVYGKAGFGDASPAPLPLAGASPSAIKIAIFGDWGSGEADALDVRNAIMALKPDYLIHLGDVYYTGTPDRLKEGLYWGMSNEADKLLKVWPTAQATGTSFTLNSNHEMYCGGRGYFDDALGSPTFAHQQGKSYFLLQNDDWQIFGLDSAYDSPATLYMKGALNAEQTSYIQKHRDTSKKVILLTHHNAYDTTGRAIVTTGKQSLWDDAKTALGGTPPDYWYWGHIHDGIIYNPLTDGNATCRSRCIGHAAVPYGAPWGLTKAGSKPPFGPSDFIDTVAFAAGTPKDPALPAGQVRNGFCMITLTGNAITEEMYDSDGTQTWNSS